MNKDLKELYDKTFLAGIVSTNLEGIYHNIYFKRLMLMLANSLCSDAGSMLGPKGGLTTYVEKYPGIWEKVGSEAMDLLEGSYKICQDMGMAKYMPTENTEEVGGKTIIHRRFLEDAREKTLTETELIPVEGNFTEYSISEANLCQMSLVKHMAWHLIEDALGDL